MNIHINKTLIKHLVFVLFLISVSTDSSTLLAQSTWRAAVLAEQEWGFREGNTQAPSGWNTLAFNDAWWGEGPGSIGFGDGDDATIIAPVRSICLRRKFEIFDLTKIMAIQLFADYDDAFVAYLNGVEIARANIGTVGIEPAFDELANGSHEAQLYQGGLPEKFNISKDVLETIAVEGQNVLAIQVHDRSNDPTDMTSYFCLLFALEEETDQYFDPPNWFSSINITSNLPLIFINTEGNSLSNDHRIPAHLGIVDNGEGAINSMQDAFNGYDGRINIGYRGASSLMFPKKNLGFETRLPDGSNNNVPLLGMPKENDWVLHGPYSDKSLMRNVLAYHISALTGKYAPRTRWCELFINDQYFGVYVLTEKIKQDKNRVDIAKLTEDDIEGDELTGGYIVSAERDEGSQNGWNSPYTNNLYYAFVDPDGDQIQPEQKDYIINHFNAFESAMASEDWEEEIETYIDVDSWVDYFLTTEMYKHIDNYKYSFYLYKDKDSNGGKIHFGPQWDINLGFGNFKFWQDAGPTGWSYIWAASGNLRPFWVMHFVQPDFIRNKMKCRWESLRNTVFSTENLLDYIEQQEAYIEEARIRNFNRWPVLGEYVWPNLYIGEDYEDEMNYLKDWLVQRLEWMDANMLGSCTSTITSEEIQNPVNLTVYPNPAREKVRISAQIPGSNKSKVILYDALGNKFWEKDFIEFLETSLLLGNSPFYAYVLHQNGQVMKSGKIITIP